MKTKFHVSVDIMWLLRMPDAKLVRWFTCTNNETAADIRRHLYGLLAKGMENVPTCDNYDEKGMCKGHPQPEEVAA